MWAFFAGALLAVLAASGKEAQLSFYAAENTPVYGSTENARKASDVLQNVSIGLALAIYAVKYLTPSDEIFDYSYSDRAGELKALAHSGAMTYSAGELFKRYTGRERPDGSDTRSFPSGHSIAAAWGCYSSAQMIGGMGLPPRYEIPAYGALALMAAGTAWGRVEGQKHYAGDVLAGLMLGAALADVSFSAFGGESGGGGSGGKLGIDVSVDRGVTSARLLAMIDF